MLFQKEITLETPEVTLTTTGNVYIEGADQDRLVRLSPVAAGYVTEYPSALRKLRLVQAALHFDRSSSLDINEAL